MNVCRFSFLAFVLAFVIFMSGSVMTQTLIEITNPMVPPGWALMERELLRANSDACEAFADYYLDERGYLLHVPRWGFLDGTDDAIETFNDWPLLNALGASETTLALFKKALNGHYLQYSEVKTVTTDIAKDGAYYKEYMPMADLNHISEGMQGFHYEGLADPADVLFQKRMRRFAGLYMNEDPDAQNYDPEHKILRSFRCGSKGPQLRDSTCEDWVGDPVEGKFNILHSAEGATKMLNMMEAYPDMLAHFPDYNVAKGDHPYNLMATNFVLNAYMLAHEEKYKKWIVEYVDAWKERIAANGGNIPSNIGLNGTIGGETDGKWYGGTYGWDFSPYLGDTKRIARFNLTANGMWPGFSNALLVTGDKRYIDVLRRQMDNLYEQQNVVNGKVMIPQMYGINGQKQVVDGKVKLPPRNAKAEWYNYGPPPARQLIEIYLWSMDRKDLERIPMEGWIAFLEGKNPDYPEQALQSQFARIRGQLEGMRTDQSTPGTRLADWALTFTPATTGVLQNLMLGGYPPPMGQLPHYRLRYFDPVRHRAGIPEDVAALVTEINNEMTKVILVNVNQTESREVIVQTGGYGEHQCIRVVVGDKMYSVNNRFFSVRLAPGSGSELVIFANRYANTPTLAFPWHGDTVPLQ